ncbi:MAG: helix-turn-helix domain-containing protein [Phycisphaerae bacterium]
MAEARGRRCRLTVWRLEKFFQRPGRQPRQRLLASVGDPEAGRLFAALGHPHRLAILKAILTGADSYQQLRDRVGLKAGPLYHHVRELRLAGLLELGGRDSYHLSQLGQDVVLLACSLARMVSKRTASAQ